MNKTVLRIILNQNKAHYRKEESIDNKMTYPLPPYSTVIGAIHNACGYNEYHNMNISIQGKYESMGQEVYRDLCFLNSVMDDRGTLVKMKNPNAYNEGYKIIASALKSQGNSFKKKITIDISENEMLDEYIGLTELRDEYQEKSKEIKAKEKEINSKKKEFKEKKKKLEKDEKKGSEEYISICNELEIWEKKSLEIKKEKNMFEEERLANVTEPLSYYASLTTSLKRYEVLYGVKLILHIDTDEDTMSDIENNIYNLVSLGRSEDFVEIEEIKRVDVTEDEDIIIEYMSDSIFGDEETEADSEIKDKKSIVKQYSGYVDYDALKLGVINYATESIDVENINVSGTMYFINKDYKLEDNKRVFNKKKVVYLSGYTINIYPDKDSKIPSEFNSYGLGKEVYMDLDGYILNLV